jgi:hypothetical protein
VTAVVLVFREFAESKQAEMDRMATLDLLTLVNAWPWVST